MTRVNGLKLWKCRVYNLISSASQVVTHRWWMGNKCGHRAGKTPRWAQIYCPEEPCWGSDGSGVVGAGPGGEDLCTPTLSEREETLEDKAESHRAPPKEGWGHSSSIKGRQTEQHWHCRHLECTSDQHESHLRTIKLIKNKKGGTDKMSQRWLLFMETRCWVRSVFPQTILCFVEKKQKSGGHILRIGWALISEEDLWLSAFSEKTSTHIACSGEQCTVFLRGLNFFSDFGIRPWVLDDHGDGAAWLAPPTPLHLSFLFPFHLLYPSYPGGRFLISSTARMGTAPTSLRRWTNWIVDKHSQDIVVPCHWSFQVPNGAISVCCKRISVHRVRGA